VCGGEIKLLEVKYGWVGWERVVAWQVGVGRWTDVLARGAGSGGGGAERGRVGAGAGRGGAAVAAGWVADCGPGVGRGVAGRAGGAGVVEGVVRVVRGSHPFFVLA